MAIYIKHAGCFAFFSSTTTKTRVKEVKQTAREKIFIWTKSVVFTIGSHGIIFSPALHFSTHLYFYRGLLDGVVFVGRVYQRCNKGMDIVTQDWTLTDGFKAFWQGILRWWWKNDFVRASVLIFKSVNALNANLLKFVWKQDRKCEVMNCKFRNLMVFWQKIDFWGYLWGFVCLKAWKLNTSMKFWGYELEISQFDVILEENWFLRLSSVPYKLL